MPRKRLEAEAPRRAASALAARLAEELRNGRDSGQPMIVEEEFSSGLMRVVVIWDEWDRLGHEDRTSAILRAYELAESPTYRDKIVLASGLTVPEAHAVGMLPFEVIPAVRKSDPVTAEECRDAMIEEGASTLIAPDNPQLRFLSKDDAETSLEHLIARLPESKQVWLVRQDVGAGEDWTRHLPAESTGT